MLFSVDLLNCISSGWFLIIQQDREYASLFHLTSSFSFLWVFIGLQHFQPAFYSASCSFVVYWYYWLFILLAIFTQYIFCLHWKEMFQWMISPWTLILVGVLYLVWVKQCFHFLVSYLSHADCFILSTQLTVLGRSLGELQLTFLVSGLLTVHLAFVISVWAYWFGEEKKNNS